MDPNAELQAILKTLLPQQLDFVQARMVARTDKEAAEVVGVSASSVYQWQNKADVDKAVALAKMDGITIAQEKLRRLASKAVDTLGKNLSARANKDQINAATEVLDRVGVMAVKGLDLSNKGERFDMAAFVRAVEAVAADAAPLTDDEPGEVDE